MQDNILAERVGRRLLVIFYHIKYVCLLDALNINGKKELKNTFLCLAYLIDFV